MERVGQIAEAGLGIVLAVTPLALWIAWTPDLIIWVMAAAAASAALLVLLAESAQRPPREDNAAGAPQLPEGFIEEVHQLFPLTYHHSRRPALRFRQTMLRLTQRIEKNEN